MPKKMKKYTAMIIIISARAERKYTVAVSIIIEIF